MAESVVAFVLDQLSTLFKQEYARLGGLHGDFKLINDELESMRAFLKEAEAKDIVETHDEVLQQWVKQVRDAAYDTGDVIDEFLRLFARRHGSGFYGRVQTIYTFIKTLRARHRISTKISDIKCRVEDIYARHQRYKSDYGIGSSIAAEDDAVRDIRGRAILLEEDHLVGIHVPKNELLSQIIDDNSHLKVVSVVGMGGSGKTTLVKRVYEDASVKGQFHSHAWETISQTFNVELILKRLIRELHAEIKQPVPQEVESRDVDSLKAFLKGFLRERMFIIVLDDIWSIDAWEALKYVLPDSNCGSRVILTTRIADVAYASRGYVYKMKVLSDEESWTLFCNISFEDKCCPPHLENVSRRILKKCEGLPLAIVAISSLLFLKDKNRLEEWEKVHCSLGGELEGTGNLDKVKKILLLSYNILPYYLKGCLLYTSIYPEDFKICSQHLIQQWITEGFVHDREGMLSAEIAEGYIDELVSRSLIQVVSRNFDGSVRYYRIHDLVREVILSKAKEHGFITVVMKGRCTKRFDNARRLVIHDSINDTHDFINDTQEGTQYKHLRSVVMFKYANHMSTSSLLKLLCGRSKLLKVLHLARSPLENIPMEVFKLFHLKYLDLSYSGVKVIPKSIKNLQNLEFLDLGHTQVMELPAEILKLGKLRELQVYGKKCDCRRNHFGSCDCRDNHLGFRAPNEIGGLVSLEYLRYIETDDGKIVKEIGKLSKLRELAITKLRREDGEQMCCSLEKLTSLRELIVSVSINEILDLHHPMSTIPQFLRRLALKGRLEKVPPWVPSLHGLTELTFTFSGLTEGQLECLQVLPNLLELRLFEAYEGERLCFTAGGFQKLKKLVLNELKRLRLVTIEEGAMPHLKHVQIVHCQLLEELPQGIQNLSELQNIHISYMPSELIAELMDGAEESQNCRRIANVPEVYIGTWRDGEWRMHFLRKEKWKRNLSIC